MLQITAGCHPSLPVSEELHVLNMVAVGYMKEAFPDLDVGFDNLPRFGISIIPFFFFLKIGPCSYFLCSVGVVLRLKRQGLLYSVLHVSGKARELPSV